MYSAHVEHVGSIMEDAVIWNVSLYDVHRVLTANGIYVMTLGAVVINLRF